MYSTYGQNPYLNTLLLDQQFSEAMKSQERHAIKAILAAKKSKIKSKGVTVSEKLTMQTRKMKNFAGRTVVSNLNEGLTGQSAQAAERQLTSRHFNPNLKSPIK